MRLRVSVRFDSALMDAEDGEVSRKWAEEDEEEESDGSMLTDLFEMDESPEMVKEEVNVSVSLSASCTPPLMMRVDALMLCESAVLMRRLGTSDQPQLSTSIPPGLID